MFRCVLNRIRPVAFFERPQKLKDKSGGGWPQTPKVKAWQSGKIPWADQHTLSHEDKSLAEAFDFPSNCGPSPRVFRYIYGVITQASANCIEIMDCEPVLALQSSILPKLSSQKCGLGLAVLPSWAYRLLQKCVDGRNASQWQEWQALIQVEARPF